MLKRWLSLLVAIVIVGGVALYHYWGETGEKQVYRMGKVAQAPLAFTVSASGTLSAVVTVTVGSQVSGQIEEILVDFNSAVKKDEVIARLDPDLFEAKVRQAEAELRVTKANVTIQNAALSELQADIAGTRAGQTEAEADLVRKQALLTRKVVAKSQVEKAHAVNEQARAAVKAMTAKLTRQKAQIQNALAQVAQAEAALQQAVLNLEHSVIRSPVDGVVISRDVDIGQTVAASLQAPVLFTIAQDLSEMQVEVSVDEADIGQIFERQLVEFTVDAFAGRTFNGTVSQIRKAPKEVSNVVTYTVVAKTKNDDLRLLPGMTANVNFIVEKREQALTVPNTALRFNPVGLEPAAGTARPRRSVDDRIDGAVKRYTKSLNLTEQQQQELRAIFEETREKARGMSLAGAGREEVREYVKTRRAQYRTLIGAILDPEQKQKYAELIAKRENNPIRSGHVWVLDSGGDPVSVPVRYGISDGTVSEIVSGAISAGTEVIVGVDRQATKQASRPRFGF